MPKTVASVTINDLGPHMKMHVKLSRRLKWRMRIGTALIWLAARALGTPVEFEDPD